METCRQPKLCSRMVVLRRSQACCIPVLGAGGGDGSGIPTPPRAGGLTPPCMTKSEAPMFPRVPHFQPKDIAG